MNPSLQDSIRARFVRIVQSRSRLEAHLQPSPDYPIPRTARLGLAILCLLLLPSAALLSMARAVTPMAAAQKTARLASAEPGTAPPSGDALEDSAANKPVPQILVGIRVVELRESSVNRKAVNEILAAITNAPATAGAPTSPAMAAPPSVSLTQTGQSNQAPAGFAAVLSRFDYARVLLALGLERDATVLCTPRVVTLSGREARVQVGQTTPIVIGLRTNTDPPALEQVFSQEQFGMTVDLVPAVTADGFNISMTVVGALREFLGNDATKEEKVTASIAGERVTAKRPLPVIRTREVSARATVSEGQTLALAGPTAEEPARPSHRRGGPDQTVKKHLLIFLTPTLIGRDGRPLHGAGDGFHPEFLP